jgi:hypothetical protein
MKSWVKTYAGGKPNYTTPEQEPVAFRNIETGEFCTGGFLRKDWAKWQPLYAAPPKREWVGLTVDEIDKFMPYCNSDQDLSEFRTFAFEIEAKLKEKNVP